MNSVKTLEKSISSEKNGFSDKIQLCINKLRVITLIKFGLNLNNIVIKKVDCLTVTVYICNYIIKIRLSESCMLPWRRTNSSLTLPVSDL